MNALFDTNILIDYLNSRSEAATILNDAPDPAISLITWMEVMVGATADAQRMTRRFLAGFKIIAIDDAIAEIAVDLRKTHRLKLPDAIVWASAKHERLRLFTRDGRDFPQSDDIMVLAY